MKQPHITTMKLSALKAAPYNPRKISEKALAGLTASIEQFGLTQPIVWNKRTKHVVSGHQRVQALQNLNETEATVVVVDWPIEKEKRANVAHNNRAIEGEFTDDIQNLLHEIQKDDAALFDSLLLDEIHVDLDSNELPINEKPVERTGGTSKTNTAEMWSLGDHRLICASSTDAKSIARLFHDGSKAACVFTDPPYGVSYGAQSGKFAKIKGDEKTGDKLALQLIRPALALALAHLHSRDDAAFYIWHASGTREDFAFAMKQAGLVEKQYLIWAKPAPVLGWGDYLWAHEPCFYACKAGNEAAFYGDRKQQTVWRVAARAPGTVAIVVGPGVVIQDGEGGTIVVSNNANGKKLRTIRMTEGEGVQCFQSDNGDVWEVKRDGKADHPTQKPVELARRAIVNSTGEGDVVYDPFLGSGTTLIGAEVTNRICYGVEIDRGYCEVIIKRYENLTGKRAQKID